MFIIFSPFLKRSVRSSGVNLERLGGGGGAGLVGRGRGLYTLPVSKFGIITLVGTSCGEFTLFTLLRVLTGFFLLPKMRLNNEGFLEADLGSFEYFFLPKNIFYNN